ncbi:Uncharacterized protein {ECO:0000313/EMBL:CCF10158.1} [Pantoea ananatis]|nr:hypothetical protein PANA5342_2765 [Pantoea ananatis LMG 5342]CRH37878.1 Uncharacterized protein {ECO:0000313/EMBL:CCF10158.1} [Pantoea ananatis]
MTRAGVKSRHLAEKMAFFVSARRNFPSSAPCVTLLLSASRLTE